MAIRAVINVFPTGTTAATPVACSVTITNPDPGAVTITSCEPTCVDPGGASTQSMPINLGRVALIPSNVSVPGSGGTLTLPFGAIPLAPGPGDGGSNPGTISYLIGANIQTADGQSISALGTVITAVPVDGRQRSGNGSYGNSGSSTQTFPAIPALPTFPLTGAVQFSYWPNAALFVVLGL